MEDRLAWGILGTGAIARIFARGVAAGKTGALVAVASRSRPKADAFAAEFSIPIAHGDYESLLADRSVEAIYIATPHPLHARWAIDAANEYAAKNSLQGFSTFSNNFSLARMVEAPWDGCFSSSDSAGRVWLQKTRLPLMPWSSQARGFFAPGLASPDKRDDTELVRCWYCEDNFQRLDRANQLAKQKNAQTIQIALAYVLCQNFPTFPLIGPRQLSEFRSSLEALKIELSERELKWLNLED